MKAMADISAGEMEEHFKVALSYFRSKRIATASEIVLVHVRKAENS